jgi:hypothetical protein
MKLIGTILVAGSLMIALPAVLTAQGQEFVDFRKTGPADRSEPEEPPELDEGPVDHPVPPAPVESFSAVGGRLQLLGFTEQRLAGGRGVLNLTSACRHEYPGSRMCTAEEINLSLNVPDPPGYGHAWVQPSPWRVGTGISDCGGWSSDSVGEVGLAIFTGPCTQCYGGYTEVACSSSLSVACCGALTGE